MRILLVLIGVVLACTLAACAMFLGPISARKAEARIARDLQALVEDHALHSALLRVQSNSRDIDFALAAGDATADSVFHAASVGKTFTATLLYMLAERGQLDLDAPIGTILDPDMLDRLFVFDGVDHRAEVTARMLMGHMSGIGDYFEGPVREGPMFLDMVAADMGREWTPAELLDFTRNRQAPFAPPGTAFHYSDTGYILLGMIVEAVTEQLFEEAMANMIWEPLGMGATTMDHKAHWADMLPIVVEGVDFAGTNALSIDWSGGGVLSTTADLATFFHALVGGELISAESLADMRLFDAQFDKGIYYGKGMMQFRLGELSPLLRSFGTLYGAVGTSGAFVLTDEAADTIYVLNVGDSAYREEGLQELISAMITLARVR